jgi:hypothetical protein
VDRGIGYWIRVQTDEDIVVENLPRISRVFRVNLCMILMRASHACCSDEMLKTHNLQAVLDWAEDANERGGEAKALVKECKTFLDYLEQDSDEEDSDDDE